MSVRTVLPFGDLVLELLAVTSNAVAVFDADDKIVLTNPAFRKLYFCDETQGQSWCDMMRANFVSARGPIIRTDDIEGWLRAAGARRGTVPFRAFEAEFHCGTWLWITETVLRDGTLLLIGADVTKLGANTRALRDERDNARRAAWTDDLTGVPNRRYTMSNIADWIEMQSRLTSFGDHTLAILDLDNFKCINDSFGHAFGDQVLVDFARQVQSNIRMRDLFGRVGGEEFVLFMPDSDAAVAHRRIDEIRSIVSASRAFQQAPDFSYSFSAGLVTIEAGESIDSVMRRADALLYIAKRAGRNRVESQVSPG